MMRQESDELCIVNGPTPGPQPTRHTRKRHDMEADLTLHNWRVIRNPRRRELHKKRCPSRWKKRSSDNEEAGEY
jgi:hypothetical protein